MLLYNARVTEAVGYSGSVSSVADKWNMTVEHSGMILTREN
jgi:hypothetical protein